MPSPGGVTHTLQADFSGTAFGGTPTWTDITAYWLSSGNDPGGSNVSITWGRQDQSSTVESSTASYVLNNIDGRFTPGRALLVNGSADPYYPHVKRHVRMRHTIFDGTTTLVLFDGLVDSWDITPHTDGPWLATVSLTDSFGRLSASTTLRSLVVEEMLRDSPVALYPLSEDAGSTSAGDITGNTPAATLRSGKRGAGTVGTFGSDIAIVGQPTGLALDSAGVDAVNLTSTTGSYLHVPLSLPTSGPWSLAIAFLGPPTAPVNQDETLIFVPWGTDVQGSVNLVIYGYDSLDCTVTGSDALGSVEILTSGVPVCDGKPHTALLTMSSDNRTVVLYVDGVSFSGTSSSAIHVASSQIALGAAVDATGNLYTPLRGTLALFGVYTTTLSASSALAYHQAAMTAFAGESTAARWARLATYRANPGVATSGTLGVVGSEDPTGQSVGDAFTSTATAEGGVIDSHRGVITLVGRASQRNPTTAATLRADHGEVDIPTTWRDDTQGLVNDVTVSRPGGATQRATNAASIAADGTVQQDITANVNSDRDAADMAGWTVAIGTQEALSSPTLTVDLYARATPSLTMAACGLNTFDVVTLTGLPAQAPASTMSFQVQGGTYTVGADAFTVQLNTTPVPPQTLRADATADTYTKLDANNVFGW